MNEIEDEHNKVYDIIRMAKEMGLDLSQFTGVLNTEPVKEDAQKTKEAFEKFEKKDEDFLDKILTKENLERGLKLLQFHPKYKGLATTLLMADDVKDMLLKNKDLKQSILSNPFILELLKKGVK